MNTGPNSTTLDILRASFVRLIPTSGEIAAQVVLGLQKANPELSACDSEELGAMLWLTLATALDQYEDDRGFRRSCRELGEAFAGFGLQAAHYPTVVELLLTHLDLQDNEREPWVQFVDRIGNHMLSESDRRAPSLAPR